MSFIGGALQWLSDFAIHVLSTAGYLGLFLLMAGESMLLPIPSEAVMPFAGVLVHDGTFTWPVAILASSAGSLAGSWLSYLLGQYGFLPLVRRYGKYVLVREESLDRAHAFFERRGVVAVFLCRFIPVVRHVSSIPAGAARMPLGPFLIASVLGATIWNTILLYAGWRFAGDAAAVAALKSNMDVAGIALLGLLVLYILYEVHKAKKAKTPPTPPGPPTRP